MPSEPRTPTEPTLEELSALIDNELDSGAQARVAEHIAGCPDCQARLDGLRQTAHAVRALPMETPPRAFSIPAERRKSFRWAPVGWAGSAAVAVLVVAFGIQNLHFSPVGSASTAASTSNYNAQTSASKSIGHSGAAPLAPPAAAVPGQQFDARTSTDALTVPEVSSGSRRLILGTDGASYSTNGRMTVGIQLQGSPSKSTNSGDQGLTLMLVRNGVGVALQPVGVVGNNGTPIFGGTYDLASLPLAEPRAGDYELIATWVLPDGSGRVLQASVPIKITG
jgi:negative regulator of sigma E activity